MVAINVEKACQTAEKDKLQSCYDCAKSDVLTREPDNELKQKLKDIIELFEAKIRENSMVVVSMKTGVLYKLMIDKEWYKNYYEMLSLSKNPDPHREKVDKLLFGETGGEDIRYGVLSLNGKGLTDYGNCHCQIDLTAEEINERVSVFKTNSYFFKEASSIPVGYRASWEKKHLLAVVKLCDCLEPTNQKQGHDFSLILLDDQRDRKQDEFIEVHIYGRFDRQAILSVKAIKAIRPPADGTLDAKSENTKFETIAEEVKKTKNNRGEDPWQEIKK